MNNGFALGAGEGDAIWFLGTLMTVKARGEQTSGGFALIEQVAPAGFGPPLHVHKLDDEAFYVLEGEIAVTCGDKTWRVGTGGFVLLPRGIPHGFSVSETAPVKLLQITTPSQFERFAIEMGEPAKQLALPPPSEPDFGRLVAVMGKYGYELAGPPPGH
jgi:quercetin dioxygenase-like cupin family protein